MNVYNYINRIDKRFRLAIFKGMKMLISPSRSYASPWIDLACAQNFFSIQRSPSTVLETGLCVDDMHE